MDTRNVNNLEELPASSNEYWEGAKTTRTKPVKLPICEVHTKEKWRTYTNYVYEKDTGSIVCPKCGWGTRLPGYYKYHDGRVYDLRRVNRE